MPSLIFRICNICKFGNSMIGRREITLQLERNYRIVVGKWVKEYK